MNKAVFAAVAALGVVGSAHAQGYPYNFSVRGGVVFPIDSSYSNISSSFFGIGIDYTLATPIIKGGETFLSLDYHSKSLAKERGSVFPFAINHKWFGPANGENNRTYFFGGIGGTVVDFNGSNTVLSARLGAGLEFNQQLFTEAILFVPDKKSGIRATSFGLFLGYKF
jgi:hypothetical protein